MNFLTIELLLALGTGLALGWVAGDETRRRKNAEQQLVDLRQKHQPTPLETQPVLRILNQQRGMLNDIHKRVLAVSKYLGK